MELTPDQKKAVTLPGNSCQALINASAGSGKTTLLLNRIAYLINSPEIKASPGEILCITFTKAAATEMKNRFEPMMTHSAPVVFGTFHAIFYKILTVEGIVKPDSLITGKRKLAILKEAMAQANLNFKDEGLLATYDSAVSKLKNSLKTTRESYGGELKYEHVLSLTKSYNSLLRTYELIDFDDMLGLTYRLFRQKTAILKKWQTRFKYILIDEAQDMNDLQYATVKLLAGENPSLFIVGDDDQSIYGFRGANPHILKQIKADYPKLITINLETNFRCPCAIVDKAKKLIQHNSNRLIKTIKSSRTGGSYNYIEAENENLMLKDICAKLSALHENGESYSNALILYRTHTQATKLIEYLANSHIPFSARDHLPNPYSHWIVQDLCSYLRLSICQGDETDMIRIMNKPNRFLTRQAAALLDMDKIYAFYCGKPWMQERILNLKNDLYAMGSHSPSAAISYIRKVAGYDAFLKEHAFAAAIKPDDLFYYTDLIQTLSREVHSIPALLDKIQENVQLFDALNEEKKLTSKGVTLMSMHASKGLQYRHVFIMNVNEGIIPSHKAQTEDSIEEERRLFYVAITRSSEALYLYSLKKGYRELLYPSRFIAEMN